MTTLETTSTTSAAKETTVQDFDPITQSLAPSHILSDGRFVHLPPPTDRDRIRFFERSIARHGLLQSDLDRTKKEDEEEKDKKDSEIKVHPLALASARLQSGIDELNRAINLNGLVSTGEYFGLSNIVDPSLEIPATAATTPTAAEPKNTATTTDNKQTKPPVQEEEQRIKALYVLKQKQRQFQKASDILKRHGRRLAAALVAQTQPDGRLRQLRPHWRLVAPEHGKRALPHATRPTEVIACDVDVYATSSSGAVVLGRLAKLVPRFATMELKPQYSVRADLEKWERTYFADSSSITGDDNDTEAMDVDQEDSKEASQDQDKGEGQVWTRAEPFAIADPSLGKLDTDFDPMKVTMLTLQFVIEKASTGFCQSACLEPISTLANESEYHQDEKILVALQHSLFCAKLFESIRRELAPDTEEVGQVRALSTTQSAAWLGGESEQNFLPPPSVMCGDQSSGLSSLCVIHCHEGEVKVQLDCEYTLRVKLMEAGSSGALPPASSTTTDSGSQSPSQLLVLCRTLLLHAQETYHHYSMKEEEKQRKREQAKGEKQVHTLKSDTITSSPRILQSAVSLGSKILFERRIRNVLIKTNQWLQTQTTKEERLQVDWLSLSVFDFCSQFTLGFRSWTVDAHLVREELTVTQFIDDGNYRKTTFHSDAEFELYLQIALKRVLKSPW